MKKILLSLTLMAALTIGTGAMAFATENDGTNVEVGTVVDTAITSEEEPIEETVNPNCPCGREDGKERENCDGTGIRKYDGTGMGNGNCDGTGMKNEGQGKLQGQGMRRGQGNCNR